MTIRSAFRRSASAINRAPTSLRRLFLGWALAGHNHDRDLLRLVQIRHAFAQGSRRLPAAVPGDEDAIEGDLGPLRLGDQIEMPARSEQNALDQPLGIHCAV